MTIEELTPEKVIETLEEMTPDEAIEALQALQEAIPQLIFLIKMNQINTHDADPHDEELHVEEEPRRP